MRVQMQEYDTGIDRYSFFRRCFQLVFGNGEGGKKDSLKRILVVSLVKIVKRKVCHKISVLNIYIRLSNILLDLFLTVKRNSNK